MTDITMLYDVSKKRWIETPIADYHELDIDKAPILIVLDYSLLFEQRFLAVWCDKHNRFEEATSIDTASVTTDAGCTLHGIIIFGKGYSENISYSVDIRWRIIQRKINGSFAFNVDSAEVCFDVKRWSLCKDKYLYKPAIKLKPAGFRVDLQKGEWYNLVANQEYKYDMPIEGFNEIMRLCEENILKLYNKHTVMRCEKGSCFDRLLCYIKRPFDMNIAFNNHYLGNLFENYFPRDIEDNFYTLCKMMSIYAADDLYKQYLRDPFAVHKKWALKYIGFKSENIINILSLRDKLWNIDYSYEYHKTCNEIFAELPAERQAEQLGEGVLENDDDYNIVLNEHQQEFYNIHNAFRRNEIITQLDIDALLAGTITWRDGRYRIGNIDRYKLKLSHYIVENPYPINDIRYYLIASNFAYCRDMKILYDIYTQLRPEIDLSQKLIDGMGDGYTSWQEDFFRIIREYRPYITGAGYLQLFNEGFTIDAYQSLARNIVDNILKHGIQYHRLKQPENIVNMECSINGYEFRLIKYEEEFNDISHIVNHQMTDYKRGAIEGKAVTFMIEKDRKYCGLIEIRDNRVSHTEGIDSPYLPDELVNICCFWAKNNNIDIRIGKLVINGEQKYNNSYQVCPLSDVEPFINRFSINTLLNLPSDKIYEGYYYNLGVALEDYGQRLPFFMGKREEFPNEFQYFNHRAPFAFRIFDGALSGIAEAQNELGILYEDGRFLDRDMNKAAEWYTKSAEQGYSPAMCNLGNYYIHEGNDEEEAVKWYRQAAELDNQHAISWIKYYEEAVAHGRWKH